MIYLKIISTLKVLIHAFSVLRVLFIIKVNSNVKIVHKNALSVPHWITVCNVRIILYLIKRLNNANVPEIEFYKMLFV